MCCGSINTHAATGFCNVNLPFPLEKLAAETNALCIARAGMYSSFVCSSRYSKISACSSFVLFSTASGCINGNLCINKGEIPLIVTFIVLIIYSHLLHSHLTYSITYLIYYSKLVGVDMILFVYVILDMR